MCCFACGGAVGGKKDIISTSGKFFHSDCVTVTRNETRKSRVVGVSFVRNGVWYVATHQFKKGYAEPKDSVEQALSRAIERVEIYRGKLRSLRA